VKAEHTQTPHQRDRSGKRLANITLSLLMGAVWLSLAGFCSYSLLTGLTGHGVLITFVYVLELVVSGIGIRGSISELRSQISPKQSDDRADQADQTDKMSTPLLACFWSGLLLAGVVLFVMPENTIWPLKLIPLIPVGIYIIWRIRTDHRAHVFRQRHSLGQCPKCGYDLRASPGRCPECGAVPESQSKDGEPPPTSRSDGFSN